MKTYFPALLATALLTLSGCVDDQPKPAQISGRDELMRTEGHWESSVGFRVQQTPASMGFSRQLVFKNDGKVHIYHNRQPELQTAYQLSNEVNSRCQAPPPQPIAVPMVRYTAEAQFPNSDLRTYLIALSPTDTTLYISGVAVCVDQGAVERYRWRRR